MWTVALVTNYFATAILGLLLVSPSYLLDMKCAVGRGCLLDIYTRGNVFIVDLLLTGDDGAPVITEDGKLDIMAVHTADWI